MTINSDVRGLLFKFVDFLYSSPEVFDRVLKVISLSSDNILFSLSLYVARKSFQEVFKNLNGDNIMVSQRRSDELILRHF